MPQTHAIQTHNTQIHAANTRRTNTRRANTQRTNTKRTITRRTFERYSGADGHRPAVAGARVRRGAGEEGSSVAAGGEDRVLSAETVDATILGGLGLGWGSWGW